MEDEDLRREKYKPKLTLTLAQVNKDTYPNYEVANYAESANRILRIFVNNFATKRDSNIMVVSISFVFSGGINQ